uniref:Uncharacterized protein n=1 Tax=Oryza meridionalis TaxID=40149 RepID=A0A0E0CIG0_9ORYZ
RGIAPASPSRHTSCVLPPPPLFLSRPAPPPPPVQPSSSFATLSARILGVEGSNVGGVESEYRRS